MLQSPDVRSRPGQFCPMQGRSRDRVPPPHVTLHEPQDSHSAHVPVILSVFVKNTIYNSLLLFELKYIVI